MGMSLGNALPWNHYSRKMMGYLFAIQRDADIIADIDDDNILLVGWGNLPAGDEFDTITDQGFVNIYRFFSEKFIWPRGFPLDKVQSGQRLSLQKSSSNVGVWQFLADNDPDVDAIYRLLFNEVITFTQREPIVLEQGVFCPFNSQNTLFMRDAFPLLYLPAFVSFRFTDILRGIVAQPILWAHDLRLGFGPATAIQERNPHDYMKDFESEFTTYLHTERAAYLAKDVVKPENSMTDNLIAVYEKLVDNNIVLPQEAELLNAWVKDIQTVFSGENQ
jgi:hypothetical protein